MSLKVDEIAVPLRWDEIQETQMGKTQILTKTVKINYPSCFTHKVYPRCLSCNDKFVPIDKGDEWCFKCKMTK